tara:strand:- start:1257 stop:1394 length:138 start_codon:yes stop_codon:yes gene_type:complete
MTIAWFYVWPVGLFSAQKEGKDFAPPTSIAAIIMSPPVTIFTPVE